MSRASLVNLISGQISEKIDEKGIKVQSCIL